MTQGWLQAKWMARVTDLKVGAKNLWRLGNRRPCRWRVLRNVLIYDRETLRTQGNLTVRSRFERQCTGHYVDWRMKPAWSLLLSRKAWPSAVLPSLTLWEVISEEYIFTSLHLYLCVLTVHLFSSVWGSFWALIPEGKCKAGEFIFALSFTWVLTGGLHCFWASSEGKHHKEEEQVLWSCSPHGSQKHWHAKTK